MVRSARASRPRSDPLDSDALGLALVECLSGLFPGDAVGVRIGIASCASDVSVLALTRRILSISTSIDLISSSSLRCTAIDSRTLFVIAGSDTGRPAAADTGRRFPDTTGV